MTGRTNAVGSGIALRIVGGTTAPANPTDKTIWLNTAVAITGYTYSATEPGSPSEGLVWLISGSASPAAFSLTRRNPIMLYPVSAKIYHSGAWVQTIGQIWLNGAWGPLGAYDLYNAGDECTAITGGWAKANGNGGSTAGWNTNGTITKGATSVTLETSYPSEIAIAPVNAVDLSAASSVIVTVDAFIGSDAAMVCICSVRGEDWNPMPLGETISGYPASAVAHKRLNTLGEISVDVSNLIGSYYVEIICAGGSGNSVTFSRLRVES